MNSNMKDKIKKAAINLFYKKGYFATGVSHIARATGIRKSSIYYHYQNKEDILVDIFRTTMNDLSAMLDERLRGIEQTEARMRAAVSGHVLFHIQRQKEAIIADSELRGLRARNYKEIIQMRDDYERKLQAVIQEGIDEGLFAGQDVKVISYAIITMCTAVCSWFKKSGRLAKEDVAQIYADFILKGLMA
jgi:AcrR family transcriptional regulator